MSKLTELVEVFISFLKLGLTAFGGPIAHIGYFRDEFVQKRQWLDDAQFSQLLSLCQFLPGPASSQLGFSLGLLRAGWLGAIAAFIAFTLPSALALIFFATYLPQIQSPLGNAALHGLKLVALPIVAQAVWQMSKQLTPDWQRRTIALISLILVVVIQQPLIQISVILLSGILGIMLCQQGKQLAVSKININYRSSTGIALLGFFFLILIGLPFIAGQNNLIAMFNAFYHAGALVFGGGHVVLPLLESAVVTPQWISTDNYLAGYGAAQAVPGPLFSVAAYLGALLPDGNGGLLGAILALTAIFLPGFLLVTAMLPLWHILLKNQTSARFVAGANAGVVGLLAAALYNPIWISVVQQPADIVMAVIGFVLLQFFRISALLVVAWCLLASMLVSLI